MQGKYYPDLVRVFYYNLKIRDEVAYSRVKGVDIIIDNDIWENVAKFPINDVVESILNGIAGFNRILAYQSFLRNPTQDVGGQLLTGGLKMDERLIHYLIVWILCPVAPIVGSSSGAGSSFSIEDNIANMNKRLEELFLLSNSRHQEVVGLIKEIDTRIFHLEHIFDEEFTHDDDISAKF